METQALSHIDAFFNEQKAKFDLITEIFGNRELFFKDEIIRKFFSEKRAKLSKKRFIWLKNRVENLKLINAMSNKCGHKTLKRTFYFISGCFSGFVSDEPNTCTVCGEPILHEFKNGERVLKYNFKQEFAT